MQAELTTARLGDLVTQCTAKVGGAKDPLLPYVGLEQIASDDPVLLDTLPSEASTSVNSVFEPGDILFGKLRPNLHKSVAVDFRGYCSTDILVLRAKPGISPRYAAKVFQWEAVFDAAVRTAEGTKMPRTAWAKLKDFPVYRPKFDEQRRTAEILDTVDAVIQQTEALIAKLKQMKAGLLHDLLTRGLDEHGEVRDPIAHSTQYKDSPVGRMPAEWQMDTLAKLAHGGISNGLFKKPELVGHGYHLVNVLDLYQNFGIDLSLVERVAVTEQEQRRYAVQTGDCFFTRSSLNLIGIAHCNVIRDVPEPCLFECHLMRVRPDQRRVLPEYLAHWCRSSWARKFFMARAKQTTMTTISQPDIAPLPVPLPSIDEQARVVKVIDAHDARIRAEEAYRDKLKLLKKGLMDDLLTGRVRVAVAMEAVS